MGGMVVAFSGKGGSGKTTLAALTVRELLRTGRRPILAVDADANANLGLTLGVEPAATIADLRDRMGEAAQNPSEIPKERLMDQWLAELLSEQAGFDLLTMGRPEGPKCYCYVNGLLRRYLHLLRANYPYVVVDCEAGMEFLSRLTVDDVDALVLVAEATPVGARTARRIAGLADSLPIRVGRRVLALNKIAPEDGKQPLPAKELPEVQAVIQVPWDGDLAERSARGEAIDAEAGAAARPAIAELVSHCIGIGPRRAAKTRKEMAS